MKVIALITAAFAAVVAATASENDVEKRQTINYDPCPNTKWWKEEGPCWGYNNDGTYFWKTEGPCWAVMLNAFSAPSTSPFP
ncbi:hypothetical protein B0J12DRAFT_789838 [Macrophomina phaseolina]|uniref:Uncharacterized protein n=1 Tax=Macrophomina phaseolina TaxID=35725 RepID=A0ABQ8FV36_9PEZI|nr:hypothetical protein B0J12DRAFT_789838 [Macrophomina phaseolina]